MVAKNAFRQVEYQTRSITFVFTFASICMRRRRDALLQSCDNLKMLPEHENKQDCLRPEYAYKY